MAKLSKTDVLHVAKLAKLDLGDAEIKKFLPQLSDVIDFVSQLNEVDTKGVEPTAQVTGLTDVFREDEADSINVLSSDKALGGTDKVYNGYFKVGAILTERSDK